MRADEHGWDPKCPPVLVDLRAGLDEVGKVLAWESEFFVPKDGVAPVPLLAAMLAGLPPVPAAEEFLGNNETGATVNASVVNTNAQKLGDSLQHSERQNAIASP